MAETEFPEDYYLTEGDYQAQLEKQLTAAPTQESKALIIDTYDSSIRELLNLQSTALEYRSILLNRLQINDNLRVKNRITKKHLRRHYL